MIGTKSETDWTERMIQYLKKRVRELERLEISGFIFKSDSPSCGFERAKMYAKSGVPSKNGRGLFADAFMKHFPLIPVEEEGRSNDAKLRENFVVRVFAYHRLQQLMQRSFRLGDLVYFHSAHKYLLLAHSPKHYQLLGKLVAQAKKYSRCDLQEQYARLFMEALSMRTTVRKNVNVLHHILGLLRDHLNKAEKENILRVIDDYVEGILPLVVLLTLLQHYVTIYNVPYIREQIYLHPLPKELMLRNHV